MIWPVTMSRLRMKVRVSWRMYSNSRRSTFPAASGRFGSVRSVGLHAGHLVRADHPFPLLGQPWRLPIKRTDSLDLGIEVRLVSRRQPVADEMGYEVSLLSSWAA